MIITREKGMRMWGGGSGSTSASGVNGGGGFSLAVTEGEGTGNAYTGFTYESGVLSLIKGTQFVTTDFFNRLFTAYDANGTAIVPNDTTTAINNLKLMVGTWTEEYLSALGKNSEGGGGGGGIELSDVWQSLKTNTDDYANQKINSAHIPDLSGTYATKTWVNQQGFVTSSGVTSVAMTVPTGLSISGTPITSTGTLALTFTDGYSIPTNTKQSNWDTAYGWGNHASAGYASASSVTTLQGYFTNGVAKTAAKLNTGTTTYTAWGQTYWSSGVPQSVSGNMTSVGSITPSANGNALGTSSARFNIYGTAGNFSGNVSITGTLGVTGATTLSSTLSVASGITLTTTKKIYFGDTSHYIELTSTGFHFSHGVYSDGFVSALGANSSGGGGGGIDIEAMWAELQGNTGTYANAKINVNHIPDISSTYGYAKASQLGSYLPLSGGTLTGTLTAPKIRINTRHSSDDTRGGIYYYDGTTDYLLIGQGSANLWIGANETVGTHHTGSTFISAGGGSAYISRLVDDARNNYIILDAGNYTSYTVTKTGTGASGTWGISVSGNSASTTALKNLYNSSTRPTSANLTHITNGGVQHFKATSSMTEGKPVSDAHILHFHWDGEAYDAQMAITTDATPTVQYRTHSTSGGTFVWGSWITALTSSNYSSYALPLSGGTLTGVLRVDNITASNSAGLLSYHPSDWTGVSNTQWGVGAADSQGVIRSGNYNLLHYNAGTNTSSTILDTNNTNVVNGVGYINGNAITTTTYLNHLSLVSGGTLNSTAGSFAWSSTSVIVSGNDNVGIQIGDSVDKWQLTADSHLHFRQNDSGGTNTAWNSWLQILDTDNYSSYALPLSGGTITGNLDVKGYFYLRDNNKGLYTTDTADNVQNTLYLNDSNQLLIGYGTSGSGYSTYLYGNNIYLRYGTSRTVGITLSSSGSTTFAGSIVAKENAYNYSTDATSYGLYMNNSDIAGVNGIYTSDTADNWAEGINFKRTNGKWDSIRALDGTFYFGHDSGTENTMILSQGANADNGLRIVGSQYGMMFIIGGGNVNRGIWGITSSKWLLYFDASNTHLNFGNVIASGDVTASSDERKKDILGETIFRVKDIASARSILYKWNDNRDKGIIHGGSIAQDWLGIADDFITKDDDGYMSLNYGALALCSAITIAREVVKHEDRITLLEKENARLKARVEELEERRA